MSLLNTLPLTFPFRKASKTDSLINELVKELDQVIELSNSILTKDLKLKDDSKKKIKLSFEEEIKEKNLAIKKLRESILSNDMLISKKQCFFPLFKNDSQKEHILDTLSVVGMCPRVNVEDLKTVADKISFCLFDESVFSENNTASNVDAANSAAKYLKDNGYKIYYLSPLSGFDYKSFIDNGDGIYSSPSYWGQHLQTFNTLALSLNVFRDLYSMIDVLKKENRAIRDAIDSDRSRVNAFHAQFKQYVSHVYSNLKILEAPLRNYVEKENKRLMVNFEEARNKALSNNEKYKNNPYEKVTYYKVFDRKTNEHKYNTGYRDMFDDFETEYYIESSYLVNRLMPVPEKAYQYKDFYAKHFDVRDLDTPKEMAKFEKNYTVSNVKKLIQSELGNNYLMVAIKGCVTNPENEDAIVLSSWGSGMSEETMIATGVK